MKRLLLLVLLLPSVALFAQNANIQYSGNAQPGDKVYSCAYDGYVNMRQTPSYQADKLVRFENGSTGAVLIQNLGEWMKIDNNGTIGYVPSRFVQDEPTVAYVGNATANDIAGVWNVRGPYNIFFIYDNGYWMAFGNYFPIAYGYYIMQNNEVKLIAVEKSVGGEPKYESVKEVYDIVDIRSLNNDARIEFLTGNETEEELEGIDVFYCTKEKFKENAKSVANRVSEQIKASKQQIQETIVHQENEIIEPSHETTSSYDGDAPIYEDDSSEYDNFYTIVFILVGGITIVILVWFVFKKLYNRKKRQNAEAVKTQVVSTTKDISADSKEERRIAEEQKRIAEEQKRIAEEQKRIAEEQKRIAEEQKRIAEEHKRKAAEERKKAAERQRQIAEKSQQIKEQSQANLAQPQAKMSVTPQSATGNANSIYRETTAKSAEPNLSRKGMNFCPYCGRKIEGAPKFCSECGKSLVEGITVGSSLSKLGDGMANICSKTSATVQRVAGNIKKNLDEKESANRKTLSVLFAKYDDAAEEKTIGQCAVMIGTGILKAQGSVVITNKALLLYKNCGPLKIFNKKIQSIGNKIGLSTTNMLDHKIPLKDIVRISRTKSVRDQLIQYSIETKSTSHTLSFLQKPYVFSQYLSKVLYFDTCIYNIDLLPGEDVKYITYAIVKSASGTNYGTLYITNMRLAFARIVGGKMGIKWLSDRMKAEEGTEELFSVDLFRLPNIISEQKSWTTCEYHLKDDGADYIIKFNNRVPKAFLGLVPNAEGDEDILRRKGNLKKGFKVAMLIASFVGLGSIADAAEDVDVDVDVDVDDMDMDSVEMDLDGDGDMDAIATDMDGDGDIDAIGLDSDGDGQIDAISVDCDNDGTFDSLAVDKNGDGAIDQVAYDTNGDGAFDQIEMDTNGDGVIDTAGVDTNGDGVVDTISESDGASDGFAQAGSGDSMMDNYYDSQNRVMELDRQIMNTPDPIQREALIRERELLESQTPSFAEIVAKRQQGKVY